MNNPTHIRTQKLIRTVAMPAIMDNNGNELAPPVSESVATFKSINEAKRASRALQKKPANGRPVVMRAAK